MSALEADLQLALDAARQAGTLVMKWFRTRLDVHLKQPDQPVTAADLAADDLIRDALMSARPDYGWLSEEGVDDPARRERRRLWLVDPIDGTRSFIAGIPEFSISIGLVEDGRAMAGVVLNPASGAVYWGGRGGGAWRANAGEAAVPMVMPSRPPAPARLVASRSEMRRGEFAQFTADPGWTVQGLGSTALKLAHVAAGAADAFLSRGPKSEWDVCAGALLVELAGGRTTDLSGRPLRFNRSDPSVRGVLAANVALHESLRTRVAAEAPSG